MNDKLWICTLNARSILQPHYPDLKVLKSFDCFMECLIKILIQKSEQNKKQEMNRNRTNGVYGSVDMSYLL